MAVTFYDGLPGHGKTYEVVTEVILPALRTGRRVVSNVAGLHYEEMRAFLIEAGIEEDAIGACVNVTNEDVDNARFFCAPGVETFVHPGDLVVLDEVWRWFGVGKNIKPEHFAFFREHRHFVDAKGVSCDLVLISQSIQDIDRKARVVVEKRFHMAKLKRLGLNRQYTVDAFNGHRISNNQIIRTYIRSYNPKYFAFYSSYEGKGGDEREVDGRMNALRSPLIVIGVPVGLLLMVGGLIGMAHIWKRGAGKTKPDAESSAQVAPVAAPMVAPVGVESTWRSVGFYSLGTRMVAVLEEGGRVRYFANPDNFLINGVDFEVYVDGKRATAYSGSVGAPKSSLLGGTK